MATSLSELRGVGSATIEKLEGIGVTSLGDLAQSDVESLAEAGIGESKAGRLIRSARENSVIVQSGTEVADEYDAKNFVTTGMDALDDAIGGGWEEGFIVALSGESGTGKTQVAFNSMVSAVEATGKPAVYVETERGRYRDDRLRSLANEVETQENIYRVKAYDLDQQENAYGAILNEFDEVSLIVVDSFTARFRLADDFQDRGSLSQRSTLMARHLTKLEKLAEVLQTPILITAQQYGNPGQYGKNSYTYGGSLFNHTVNYEVEMRQAKGEMVKAMIRNHPGQAEKDILVKIGTESLEAWEDD